MAIVNLSSPWVGHYRKLQEMFRTDRQVNVVFDAETMKISLYVDNQIKADALSELLIPELEFGNVKVPVEVIPSNDAISGFNYYRNFRNDDGSLTIEGKFRAAFAGNSTVDDITRAVGIGGHQILFIIFKPIVAQYFNDDISDLFGLHTTVYEDLARDIFVQHPFIFFSTAPRVVME